MSRECTRYIWLISSESRTACVFIKHKWRYSLIINICSSVVLTSVTPVTQPDADLNLWAKSPKIWISPSSNGYHITFYNCSIIHYSILETCLDNFDMHFSAKWNYTFFWYWLIYAHSSSSSVYWHRSNHCAARLNLAMSVSVGLAPVSPHEVMHIRLD